jgi:hypothetical protein
MEDFGLVGFSAMEMTVVNTSDAAKDPHFAIDVDGIIDGPVLATSLSTGKRDTWSVILRGRKVPFNSADEYQLNAIMSFVVKSVAGFSENSERANFIAQLAELLDLGTLISSTLAVSSVVNSIQIGSQNLLQAEKCELLFVKHGDLVDSSTRTKRGARGEGIAGTAVQNGKLINESPATCRSFVQEIDAPDSSTAPKYVLACPIFSSLNEVIAVCIVLPKTSGEPFDEMDERLMESISVFAGVGLENARIYQASINATKKMHQFVEKTLHTDSKRELLPLLEGLMGRCRKVTQAIRVSYFQLNSFSGKLELLCSKGCLSVCGTVLVQDVVRTRKRTIFHESEIKKRIGDKELPEPPSGQYTFAQISAIFGRGRPGRGPQKRHMIGCFPVFDSANSLLGVLEAHVFTSSNDQDMSAFDPFVSITCYAVERIRFKEHSFFRSYELDPQAFMSEEERSYYDIPANFKLERPILDLDFDVREFDGIGLFRVAFQIFARFELLNEFHITSEKLFYFLNEVRHSYDRIPYYNWKHAVDATQFVGFALSQGDLTNQLTKRDILCLIVAVLCHDCGHDGFREVSGAGSEIAMNVLYQMRSILETNHATIALSILSKERFNLFNSLDIDDATKCRDLVLQLILATDMGKHFDIVSNMNICLREKVDIAGNEGHRLLFLKILIKCADLAPVVRRFEVADCYRCPVCEEFFRQGDLTKAAGMVWISHGSGNDALDRPKSCFGFFKSVCMPCFEVLAKFWPDLGCCLEKLMVNLGLWKEKINTELKTCEVKEA